MKTTSQAAIGWCVATTLLSAAGGSQAARRTPLPPRLAPVPAPLDINSEGFQRQLAADQSTALKKASRSPLTVERTFIVGWEMHHGYFLSPPAKPNKLVMPDFVDNKVEAQFDREYGQETLSAHVGQRLVCECKGVAWFYYEPRFLIRSAKLKWVSERRS